MLGADSKKFRTADSMKIIEYSFANFELVNIKEKMEKAFREWQVDDKYMEIIKGEDKAIELVLGNMQCEKIPINKNNLKDITIHIDYEEILQAPVFSNQIVGDMIVKINDNIIARTEILMKNEIDRKNMLEHFSKIVREYKNLYLQKIQSVL